MSDSANVADNASKTDSQVSNKLEHQSSRGDTKHFGASNGWIRYGWIIILAVIIGFWALVTEIGFIESNLLPSPTRLMDAYADIFAGGRFWDDIVATVVELAVASFIFIVAGTVLGIYFGSGTRRFDVTHGPISTIFAMPKITFLPVFVLVFGLGMQQKVLFGALYGFFPLIMNTMVGARSVQTTHQQLFDAVGANTVFRAVRLTLPSMLPYFMTGLRIGYVYAGIGVLLAEMYVSSNGIGQQINSAADQITLDQFWAYVIIASLILVIGAGIIKLIENRLDSWRD